MQVGELVVLVQDVEGVKAGREGRIMGIRDNMVMVGCRSRDRLQVVSLRAPGRFFRRNSSAVYAKGKGVNLNERGEN